MNKEFDACIQGAVCGIITWAIFIGNIFYLEGCDMQKQTAPIKASVAEKGN